MPSELRESESHTLESFLGNNSDLLFAPSEVKKELGEFFKTGDGSREFYDKHWPDFEAKFEGLKEGFSTAYNNLHTWSDSQLIEAIETSSTAWDNPNLPELFPGLPEEIVKKFNEDRRPLQFFIKMADTILALRNIDTIVEYQKNPPYTTPANQSVLSRSNFPGTLQNFLRTDENSSLVKRPEVFLQYSYYYRQVMQAVQELGLDAESISLMLESSHVIDSEETARIVTRVFDKLCQNGVPPHEGVFG